MEGYKQKFKDLLQKIYPGTKDIVVNNVVSNLFIKYGSIDRHYHNITHVVHCLEELDQLEKAVEYFELPIDLLPIKLALWFHDVEKDEIKSKDFFGEAWYYIHESDESGYKSEVSSCEVNRFILATTYNKNPKDIMEKYIKDIDCSILGKKTEVFKDYENKVRLEYPQYSDKDFCEGRAKILKTFLARENVYYTRYFRDRYERQALQNLAASIEHLEKGECVWNGVS